MGDYNAGRRTANAGGQAGAFGTTTGFGGFGGQNTQSQGGGFGSSTGGNLFGSTNNTSGTGFGANTTTSGGFGGSGFGAKSTGGGLFGSTTNNAQPSASIFGGSTNTGFGQQNNNNAFGSTQTAAGAFGQSNQQKPGGLFGSTNTTGNTFGNTSTGGFGSSTNLFGQQNQNQTQSNPFGTAQQPQSNPFGSTSTNTGLGAFGNTANNQQKPPLFGNAASGTGTTNLFGGNNTQNTQQPAGNLFGSTNNSTGGGLFGNSSNNNNSSGGLFGPKPATSGGLFGNSQTNQQSTSGGLFGQPQNQQNQAPGLFAASQQKPLGNTGGGLFGNNNQQSANNNSLFGPNPTNQNQSSVLGSSIMGNQPNPLAAPQGMVASLNDPFPYGSASIFSGLPPVANSNPGPIATPIQAGQKQKKPAVLPHYKLNPAMSPRFVTPQRRGYGFSYSTYGTPTSAMSTPGGLSNSLLGNSIGRSLGKSFSTSNLRGNFDPEASGILAPGAFSVNSGRFSQQGSMKKLTIDRTLRTDLFANSALQALPSAERAEPKNGSSLRKRVSFDAGATSDNNNGDGAGPSGPSGSSGAVRTNENSMNGALDGELSPTPTAEEQGYLRSSSRVNLFNGKVNGGRRSQGSLNPEMSQVQGNELAIVHEDDSFEPSRENRVPLKDKDLSDPIPGDYWCAPPMGELRRMNPRQLKNIQDFAIGRDGCGQCLFLRPVDLSSIDLNKLFGGIADINIRSLTIYPNNAYKPPAGGGLNVPARITLQNSWPRSRDRKQPLCETSGPAFEKHLKRLRMVHDAKFIKYDKDNGEWTFEVPHFTTYALDYDDEMETDAQDSSALSNLQSVSPTPTRGKTSRVGSTPGPSQAETAHSSMLNESPEQPSSEPEDTFEFKKRRLPGGFDDLSNFEVDGPEVEMVENGQSFLGQRSAALTPDIEDEPSEMQRNETVDDRSLIVQEDNQEDDATVPDMVGSFPEEAALKSILKNGNYDDQTPRKAKLVLENDWTEQLQKTISPRKRDRQALRESQHLMFSGHMDEVANHVSKQPKLDTGEITTSIDLMKSLFGKEEMRRSMNGARQQLAKQGFQV